MKECSSCKISQEESCFYAHRGKRTRPGYLNPVCKTCHKEKTKQWAKNNPDKLKPIRQRAKLKEKYGISTEQYQEFYERQQGKCYVCDTVPSRARALNVDHDHQTGQVRKLLCDRCNMALGLLNDDPKLLTSLLEYLNEHSTV